MANVVLERQGSSSDKFAVILSIKEASCTWEAEDVSPLLCSNYNPIAFVEMFLANVLAFSFVQI